MEKEFTQEELELYSRQLLLPGWGEETQLLLKSARVLVIGAGALGCAVLQSLARSGVGALAVADDDLVSLSNLQRQSLFDQNDIGKKKIIAAAEKIRKINPHISVEPYDLRVTAANVLQAIESFDVIVDGSDNFAAKYLLNDACVISHKPLVFGSVEAFEGQVSVFNYRNGPTYRCIFPQPPVAGAAPDCSTIGVTAALPLLVGSVQAGEVMKILTGKGETLSGKLLLIDQLKGTFQALSFQLNPENKANISLHDREREEAGCGVADVQAVGGNELRTAEQRKKFRLVDVRAEEEHNKLNIGGENIPFYSIDEFAGGVREDERILTYCNSGLAAKQAATLISMKKKMRVYYLDAPLESLRNS